MGVKTLDISEARTQFNHLDKTLKGEGIHVVRITRRGQEAFAVVDIDYLESLLETLEVLADPEALAMLQASVEDIEAGRVHDLDEVMEELL